MKALRILRTRRNGAIEHLALLKIAQQIDQEKRQKDSDEMPPPAPKTNHNHKSSPDGKAIIETAR